MNKAVVLIDVGYFNKVLEKFGKPKIDYHLLSEKICQGTERLRTYYYTCMPYQSGHQPKKRGEDIPECINF